MYETMIDVGLGETLVGFSSIIFVIAMILLISRVALGSKSHQYRKYLTNLFVSAKIRELSKKENVDLTSEELELAKYISLGKKDRIRDLDDKIEAEILDKIEESKEKKK